MSKKTKPTKKATNKDLEKEAPEVETKPVAEDDSATDIMVTDDLATDADDQADAPDDAHDHDEPSDKLKQKNRPPVSADDDAAGAESGDSTDDDDGSYDVYDTGTDTDAEEADSDTGPDFAEPENIDAGDDADAEVAPAARPPRTAKTTAKPAAEEEDELPELSFGNLFRRLYQVTYSKTVGLVIILVLTVMVLIGVLVQQADAATWQDPAARDAFVTAMTDRYGTWARILNLFGFFHMFTSIGFYVVIGALAVSISGCTIHRIPQLWQRWRHPKTLVSSRFFSAARYQGAVVTKGGDAKALALAMDNLKAAHYRVIKADDNSFYADRFAWGGFGTVTAHLSFIIIIASFMITGLTSYEVVANLSVGGAAVQVRDTDLAIKATSFDATFDDATGKPTDYVSHVVLTQGDQVVKEQDVRVNQPLTFGRWMFNQNSYGNGIDIHVVDGKGNTIFTGAVSQDYQSTDGTLSIGTFKLPDLGLSIDVVSVASGQTRQDLAPGQVAFVVYSEDMLTQAMGSVIVDQGNSGKITDTSDLTFFFDRENQYTAIQMRTDPGGVWLWTGAVLLVLGMTVTFTCRHRRVWVRAEDGQMLFASADKEDSGFRQNFDHLVAQAETWFPVRRK